MFNGFSPETVDFLWGIRMNNNREWFTQHKKQYQDTLYEPMKALGQAVYDALGDLPGSTLKVSRIYRDARMHHPDPYKESLWFCIRQGSSWAENPCLFFEICPDGISYGFSLYRPSAATMTDFRRDIAGRPDAFTALIEKTQKDTGMAVTARCYKRPKETEDARLAPYFSWRDEIGCIRTEPVGEDTFGPQLEARVTELLRQLLPLYRYFLRYSVA